MPTFKAVPDVMIAAFAPVTGRLMTRLARNSQAIEIYSSKLIAAAIFASVDVGSSYTAIGTIRMFIPFAPYEISIGGSIQGISNSGTSSGDVRWSDGTDVSPVFAFTDVVSGSPSLLGVLLAINGTTSGYKTFTLEGRETAGDMSFSAPSPGISGADFFRVDR